MKKVPHQIDGANVLYWAQSGETPFFMMTDSEGHHPEAIFNLAICQYEGRKTIYRFSCNSEWECLNDSDFSSIAEAMTAPSNQYDISQVIWKKSEMSEIT